jgi:hypothetical protein
MQKWLLQIVYITLHLFLYFKESYKQINELSPPDLMGGLYRREARYENITPEKHFCPVDNSSIRLFFFAGHGSNLLR